MTAYERATYLPLIGSLAQYAERNAMLLVSSETTSALKEIKVRLERLDRQYGRLLELNEKLRAGSVPKIEYDEMTATFRVQVGQQPPQTFKIPGVSGPFQPIAAVDIASFEAGVPAAYLPPKHDLLRMDLEELLEAYYYGVHRLTVLVRQLPGQKKFFCREMIVVRNDLLEHTKDEHIYGFGYGTGGPFVRPARPAGSPVKDKGAVENTTAFIESLHAVFHG